MSAGTMTPGEAAERLGKDPATVQRWLREGRLRGALIGSRWAVDAAGVEEMLAGLTAGTHAPDPVADDALLGLLRAAEAFIGRLIRAAEAEAERGGGS